MSFKKLDWRVRDECPDQRGIAASKRKSARSAFRLNTAHGLAAQMLTHKSARAGLQIRRRVRGVRDECPDQRASANANAQIRASGHQSRGRNFCGLYKTLLETHAKAVEEKQRS
jgi:hypothetical protein